MMRIRRWLPHLWVLAPPFLAVLVGYALYFLGLAILSLGIK